MPIVPYYNDSWANLGKVINQPMLMKQIESAVDKKFHAVFAIFRRLFAFLSYFASYGFKSPCLAGSLALWLYEVMINNQLPEWQVGDIDLWVLKSDLSKVDNFLEACRAGEVPAFGSRRTKIERTDPTYVHNVCS